MSDTSSQKPLWPAVLIPVLCGMAACQAVSTFWVRDSNFMLYEKITALAREGLLTVPNQVTAPLLLGWKAALQGGVFYTLSTGAGLAVSLSLVCLLLAPVFSRAPKIAGGCLSLFWLAGLAFVNSDFSSQGAWQGFRFVLYPSLILFFTVPAAVVPAWILYKKDSRRAGAAQAAALVVPVICLAALWYQFKSPDLFDNLRDDVLLRSSVGRAVNDAYYRYTLYAATAFKSQQQKLQKTLAVSGLDEQQEKRIADKLAQVDYFLIPGKTGDMEVELANGEALLSDHGRLIMEKKQADFLKNPAGVVREFSRRADPYGPFRRLTYYGLLLGFPLFLYMCTFSLFQALAGLLVKPSYAAWVAGPVCLALGGLMLMPLADVTQAGQGEKTVAGLVASDQLAEQLAGLKKASKSNTDIYTLEGFDKMLHSPHVVVRRWTAKVLGKSKSPEALEALLLLTRDPHPNVRCLAMHSAGRRGRGQDRVKSRLLEVLETSNHWYVQLYAYEALERMGWKPDKHRDQTRREQAGEPVHGG